MWPAYVTSDFDLIKKTEIARRDNKVLWPLKRRASVKLVKPIKICANKQVLRDYLVSLGIAEPVGVVLTRTGRMLEKPKMERLTTDQQARVAKLKVFMKKAGTHELTFELLDLITK